VAVLDLARIVGPLGVRHARGDEQHEDFRGALETPEPGEVIFADAANHAHARRWTFRQSRRSTVTPETRRALIVSEALHPTAAADVPALLDALARSITALLWCARLLGGTQTFSRARLLGYDVRARRRMRLPVRCGLGPPAPPQPLAQALEGHVEHRHERDGQ